ncbi:hypothetical protein [Micrococcus yunnanensis]|uniref:hypothetical protein n=1 Tax=Micrococcus yunnanensis TaxID=566027 RepID=UPI00178931D2|nr:hypothetical protein [Micrococcus yunnanensis]MBE1539923.1 hypothetical protein [Micrococcus yunnanensis]
MFNPAEFARVQARNVALDFIGELAEGRFLHVIFGKTGRRCLVEGRPVFSCRVLEDGSERIEICLMGEKEPRYFQPDDNILIIFPIASSAKEISQEEALAVDQILDCLMDKRSDPPSRGDGNLFDQMKSLGLIQVVPFNGGVRYTRSAISIREAFEQNPHQAIQLIRRTQTTGTVIINNHTQLVSIDGEYISFDQFIGKISESVSGEVSSNIISEIKENLNEGDEESLVSQLLGLGKEVIVGAMGSGAWSAIVAASRAMGGI